jgi:hypothetical protein
MPAKDSARAADEAAEALPTSLFFDRLPEWVMDTLSSEQKEAIHKAAQDPAWDKSPVNIRFTIPFFGKKFYITIVSGSEKRSADRRATERNRYPLRTISNVFFFIGLATIFYMAAVVALALQSALVEF